MKIYTKLSKEDAVGIPADTLVYITCDAKALHQCPSFVLGCVPDGCLVAVCGQQSPSPDDEFPFSTYGDDWYVEIQNGFTIETPDGTLHVWGKQGDNYPGVYVDLYLPGISTPIGLAMTEYTPGGEGLCGFDPNRPWLTQAELDEVPAERIADKNGQPIPDKDGVTPNSDHTITAGLVTRAWPDEVHDQDYHKRTFHIGYKSTEMEEK